MMEVQNCNCSTCKPRSEVTHNDSSSTTPSASFKQDPINKSNLCTTASSPHLNTTTSTFTNATNQPQRKMCISPYSVFQHFSSGELRNHYWHHRWRRRSIPSPWSSWCRWEALMKDEFPFVSLRSLTGFPKNPSLQDSLVKLRSCLTLVMLALVMVSTFDFKNRDLGSGACMMTRFTQIPLMLLIFLVSLVYMPVFIDLMLVITTNCVNLIRSFLSNLFTSIDPLIKFVVNLYYFVKNMVVFGTVSSAVMERKKYSKRCKSRLNTDCTTSSVVLLCYTALLAITQSTGKIIFITISSFMVKCNLSLFVTR